MNVHESFEELLQQEALRREGRLQFENEQQRFYQDLMDQLPYAMPLDKYGIQNGAYANICEARLETVFGERANMLTNVRYQAISYENFESVIGELPQNNKTQRYKAFFTRLKQPEVQNDIHHIELMASNFRKEILITDMSLLYKHNLSAKNVDTSDSNTHAFMLTASALEYLQAARPDDPLEQEAISSLIAETLVQYRLFLHDNVWPEVLLANLPGHEKSLESIYSKLDSVNPEAIVTLAGTMNAIWDLPTSLRPDVIAVRSVLSETVFALLQDMNLPLGPAGMQSIQNHITDERVAENIAMQFRYQQEGMGFLLKHQQKKILQSIESLLHRFGVYAPSNKSMVQETIAGLLASE